MSLPAAQAALVIACNAQEQADVSLQGQQQEAMHCLLLSNSYQLSSTWKLLA